MGIAVLFALTGFIGFESTAIFRDEARNPEITIPRATYLAVLIIAAFYALSTWALVLGAGVDHIKAAATATLNGSANLLLDQTLRWLGHTGRDAVNCLLLSSLFACVLSFHNVIARYQHALARKGLLPARFAVVHKQYGSPAFSSMVQTGTAAIILGLFAILKLDPLVGVFGSMAGVSTMGMIILMLTTSIVVVVFFRRKAELDVGKAWSTGIAPGLAILGLIWCLWLVLSNFTLVTGGSLDVSIAMAAIPAVAMIAVAGFIRGQRLLNF
jgi:amino acid transporter